MVSTKLVETRKYYAVYNTLDDSYGYMSQEVKTISCPPRIALLFSLLL